jgi:quinol monooxygenase YgiN
MLIIIGTFRVKPDQLDDARPIMEKMVLASRKESGCLSYSYAEDISDAGLIRVSEIWTDQQALDWHMESRHISEWRAEWPQLGISERHLMLYSADSPRPC